MAAVEIELNGRAMQLPSGTTVEEVVALLIPSLAGCAVAKNGEVLPRSAWAREAVAARDRIEVLGAVAGG